MAEAELAVVTAALALPDAMAQRIVGAHALNDEDRKALVDIARRALAPLALAQAPA